MTWHHPHLPPPPYHNKCLGVSLLNPFSSFAGYLVHIHLFFFPKHLNMVWNGIMDLHEIVRIFTFNHYKINNTMRGFKGNAHIRMKKKWFDSGHNPYWIPKFVNRRTNTRNLRITDEYPNIRKQGNGIYLGSHITHIGPKWIINLPVRALMLVVFQQNLRAQWSFS